jgi:uncharacterized protein YdhG (YjbR/CyaY superfamily)
VSPPPETVDEYLAAVPDESRGPLEELRETIREAAPEAEETISYRIPTFKHQGSLVAFAAFKDHLSFFPMSSTILDRHADEVAPFRTSKGTLQFAADDPIPGDLVRRIVKERIEENEA